VTLAIAAIIMIGIGLFLAGRVLERKKGVSRMRSSMRILGLALVFFGALKIVFGI